MFEGMREQAIIKMATYKSRAVEYFNRKVIPRVFQLGDLVLRDTGVVGHPPPKFRPNWERPYEVICNHEKWAYSLKDMKEKQLSRP